MSVERHLHISRSGIESLDEGLVWVVQQLDKEFTGADMVKISVEQFVQTSSDPNDGWHSAWTAAISGIVEETP